MLHEQTFEKLFTMKLFGMTEAYDFLQKGILTTAFCATLARRGSGGLAGNGQKQG